VTAPDGPARDAPDRRAWPIVRAGLIGALLSIGFAFPAAMLLMLVYRFPVPFVGYESGIAALPHALVAVAFYGVLGGFLALGLAGTAAGVAIHRSAARSGRPWLPATMAAAGGIALIAALTMSVLDKVIGPW
jgi:hypothetical protein